MSKDKLSWEDIAHFNKTKHVACAECGEKMLLKRSRYGLFYGCSRYPGCPGTHGAHPDGRPLGKPATIKVKQLRIRAHELLENEFGRKGYFGFLKKTLGISGREAHVAMLSENQLNIVIETLSGGWHKK